MIKRLITQSYENVEHLDCCHEDKSNCCCYDCLKEDFRKRPDEYDCEKKMNYYVAKYAASYSSEFFNYLQKSAILDNYNNSTLNILSLGCGFSPDYYAITKYIADKELNINLLYKGKDRSPFWNNARLTHRNVSYELCDLCNPFIVDNYDIVIMSKVFSTIYKHKNHAVFLNNLQKAITAVDRTILIFNDINSIDMGRDVFNIAMIKYFKDVRKFYTDTPKYKESNWEKIDDLMIFPIIPNSKIDPLNMIRQFVYFEYRK